MCPCCSLSLIEYTEMTIFDDEVTDERGFICEDAEGCGYKISVTFDRKAEGWPDLEDFELS